MGERFPFGAPVQSAARQPSGRRRVFVLGAYPSAVHVRWTPPADSGLKPVRALAVDNEPEPFWDGGDQPRHIEAWATRLFDDHFGTISSVGRLNGSSGRWVTERVLEPLGATRDEVWFSDCLDTYRASRGQAKRCDDTYAPFARQLDLPPARLGGHPNEDQIVREALGEQRERLMRELEVVSPDLVITLGNASARVFHNLTDLDGDESTLSHDGYGDLVHVSCLERPIQWLALTHPGGPKAWQETHERWVLRDGRADAKRSDGDSLPRWLPRQLLAAGAQAPEVLAEYVAKRLAGGARERADRRRSNAPQATVDELVRRAIRSHVQLARSEGAVAGLTMTAAEITTVFGSAGTLTLPTAVTTLAADLTTLAWLQCRMVLEVAALRGDPLDDADELRKELLILWGIHSPTRQIGAAASKASQRVGKRLLERYLKGAALQSIKSMFKVVGVKFSRAAVVRGLPVVNIPVNAAVNDVSTRTLARKADAYYRKKNG